MHADLGGIHYSCSSERWRPRTKILIFVGAVVQTRCVVDVRDGRLCRSGAGGVYGIAESRTQAAATDAVSMQTYEEPSQLRLRLYRNQQGYDRGASIVATELINSFGFPHVAPGLAVKNSRGLVVHKPWEDQRLTPDVQERSLFSKQ